MGERGLRTFGLLAGPAAFALLLLVPLPGLPPAARAMLAVLSWVATWWITEAVPLGVASLLPVVLLPLLRILGPAEAAAAYGEPAVFLFLGGFLLARAFEDSGLHRRVAWGILARTGTGPRQVLLGMMAATAVMSMWVSNTATALIMLPVALGVAGQMREDRAASALVLGVAYAASIGGMATLIGTPPNAILAGLAPDVTFGRWMLVGVPVAALLFALTFLYLSRALLRGSSGTMVDLAGERRALGRMTRAERSVLVVFLATVLLWVFRTDLPLGVLTVPGWADALGLQANDASVAILAAVALFVLPDGRGSRVLTWERAVRIPWEVLLLFGGGFALAAGFEASGLAEILAEGVAALAGVPLPLLLFALSLVVILASEVASNTALAALLLPVLAASGEGLGVPPAMLMVTATLAASCGFMLPVATPPNAVAYSTGRVSARRMARTGVLLDILAAGVITLAALLLVRPVFGA